MPSQSVHIIEKRSGTSRKSKLITLSSSGSTLVTENTSCFINGRISNWTRFLTSIILPEGFPDSVSEDYISFQLWDTLQGLTSYIRGIITTHAVLKGLGVGNEDASAGSATMQWVLRDGCSLLGGILFAWIGSSRFGENMKAWRLFADIINDLGLTLELLSPITGKFFLIFACVGSICKALCGVAAGATRAGILAHFSGGNERKIADISSKEGVQETLVSFIGMVLGLVFSATLQQLGDFATWMIFFLLTLLHVYANYRAVKSLCFRTLNPKRLSILTQNYITHGIVQMPKEISVVEPIFFQDLNTRVSFMSLSSVLKSPNMNSIRTITQQIKQRYIVLIDGDYCGIAFHETADDFDILQGFMHAQYCRQHGAKNHEFVRNIVFQHSVVFRNMLLKANWSLDFRDHFFSGSTCFWKLKEHQKNQ